MNTLSIPVVAMASISFYVGIYHLLIYFRRRQNRADLTFALLCFTIVFYDAFCAGLYNATSLLEGVQWQRAQFVVLAIFVLTFLWFVSDYTHQKPGSSIYLFSAFYLVAFIIQLVDRSDLTFLLNSPSIKHITLSHAHTYYEAALGPFTAVQSLMGVVASTYVLAMGIRYFRDGFKREAIPLILGIVFMYAAGVHDTLVSNGVYDAVYLIEYAYTAMILMTTYSLSNTVVEAAIAKEELRKSEERFRALVETTSDWVWEIDANGVYTYASPTVRDLLGYEPEEILGRRPCDLMPADEAERCSVIFRDTIFQKKLLESVENVNQRKDGRFVTLETSGVPFFASDGSLLGYRGIDRDITERKLAEQALQAKTKELDLYFLSSLDLLCIADTNGYFRRVNPEWETTLGYAVNELEGRQFLEFVHPEDLEATMAAISRLADQQQVLNFENRYRCKDGSYRWIEWRSYPRGQMIYAVARDITERKQIERELRESEERYRMLVEVSPTATWIARNDILTYANPAALQILGATDPGQVVGRPALDFIHPDYHPAVKERIAQMRGEGRVAPLLEEKYVRLDGGIVDVEVVAAPFTTSNGAVIQVFFQDITKRKRAEEALRESEARHRALIESQIDLVSRYLPDTTLTFVNDAYCKFFGKSREELIGQSYMFMIVPEYRKQVAADTKKLAEENGTVTGEYLNYRYDGQERWIQWVVKCITDENDRVIELQAVGRDITLLKQAEAERERLIAELEGKNAELERFTYTVSHDLKAPLITIRGFLGFVEQDAEAGNLERMKMDILRISAATDKMQRLLDELLELSRVGRLMNPPVNIAFGDLIRDALKLVEGRLRERNVEINVQDNLPAVFGDSQRLLEVIQNLIDNAVKFIGKQPKPIIEIGTQGEENGMPVFFIRDNGIGIAPEHHERVFGLFNKLNLGIEGTGVGLAIVKRIIEVHGGRIWVESEEGKGATFYFTLEMGTLE